ncbi:formate--tetrahydrofolate ligase [Alginatibacterium sediminis]|uniref:non-specific protein-tyrosine kinase n=1 Tax=Alginatibacterium sediminis TaxID=2164068 RepID=A0A420E6D8_9ALTE|nr:polysaccharide biosynthesis tyrosine autokinase [Alginatibacterium sediminis]RKF13227.1 formate--tetrahydrofolate ligase [Alginatibacterium sediminis]
MKPALINKAKNKLNGVPNTDLIDLNFYFDVLKSRWFFISLFTLLVLVATIVSLMAVQPIYRATAVLLIESEQPKAVVSIDEIYGIDSSKKEYYFTQFELLKTRSIARKVSRQLDLYSRAEFIGVNDRFASLKALARHWEPTIGDYIDVEYWLSFLPKPAKSDPLLAAQRLEQRVLNKFKQSLTITPIRNTQLVRISFDSIDPELAAAAANAVGKTYIDSNLEARLMASREATEWLSVRVETLKQSALDSEDKLSEYLEQEGLVDVSGIDSLAGTELTDLSRRLSDARDKRVAAESIFYLLKENQGSGLAGLGSLAGNANHPQLRDIRLAEIDAERRVSELSKRYGPKHDRMQQAQAYLQSVRANAKEVLQDLASGISKELRSARQQEASLKAELDAKKQEFQSLAIKRASYEALKREVTSNRSLYDLFLTRQKETSVTGDFQSAIARFTDYATAPLEPAKPRKKLISLVALILGFIAAVLLAFASHSSNDTISQASDIESRLRLHPLGVIPMLKKRRFGSQELSDASVLYDKRQTRFSEAIRTVRTAMMLSLAQSKRKFVSVTSSVPGEGKTTVSINLAQAMAGMEKVLLIDCDLRQPSVGERFGLSSSHPGLSNLLVMGADLEDCVFVHEKSGLHVLAAGLLSPYPQELLSSPRFRNLLRDLSRQYNKIVIDTPPISAVSDALIVGRLTTASILVVKADSTRFEQVSQSIAKLIHVNVAVDGVILNQISEKNEKEYKYYNYYRDLQKA